MISLRKCVVCFFVVLLVSQNSSCQQSESDEGDSLGTPVLEQNIQTDKQRTLDAPETTTQATDVQVGGAHLWQAPYDTHMVGDAQDMRYGWIYQLNNNDPQVGSSNTYQGVPQDLWHSKFDDHVKSFGPNLDQEIAALNEVDSNLGYQTIDTMNLAMPMTMETTAPKPIIEPETMPDRDMSHMSIIEKVQQSAPSMNRTQLPKETSDTIPNKMPPKQMGISSDKVQMQKVESLQSSEQTLLMPASAPLVTAWKSCGQEVVLSQSPQQISHQFYPQSEIQTDQTLQQQIPMFTLSGSQQHVMQQQPMFMPSQQDTTFEQMRTQNMPFEQQHVMQQQPMLAPIQQKMIEEKSDSQMPSFEQQHLMQQHPMLMPTQQRMLSEQSDSKMPSIEQQHLMQQHPMLMPTQQRMLSEQSDSKMPSVEQQHLMQQQPMQLPTQQRMPSEQSGTQTSSIEQVQQQPMVTPTHFSQMSYFDQRLVQQQQQQMPIQNQETFTSGQKFYIVEDPKLRQELQMMMRDQQSTNLQQSDMRTAGQNQHPINEQPMTQIPQQQPMMKPEQQMLVTNEQRTLQENMGLEQRVASQQQMWMQTSPQQQTSMMDQQTQSFGPNQATLMMKTTLDAGQTTNQQQMLASNSQKAFPQQHMPTFEQRQGFIQQQQMPGFQQQEHVNLQPGQIFAVQMQPQQNSQSQSNSEATVAGTPVQAVMGPMDQGKFDEMRAALSASPDVSTLHLLKRLKTGGHGVVFAIPAVYGGYAGGYSGATYAKPVYLSPMYAAHEHSGYEHSNYEHSNYETPLLLETNPKTTDDSSSTQSMTTGQITQIQGTTSGSESAREIKADSSKLTSCQTLPTTPSMAEEDTMYAAASEMAPVEVGASHRGRGCKCNSLEHDDDDDYDPPVAAVPIEIHPDGRLEDYLSVDRISVSRNKRGVYGNSNYIQEINEAVKDVGSLDPIDVFEIGGDKTRLERYTPASNPYIEFNANQYLPIREVDLNTKEQSKGSGPNIFNSLVQQTEQSIKEAIAKATRPQGQVQLLNDADASYAQDHGQQPQIIPLDDYIKQTSSQPYETPVRVKLQPAHQIYPAPPRLYSEHSSSVSLPEKSLSHFEPRRFAEWQQPTDLMKHPIQVILQTIESRLTKCCESCKTEVLNEISEKLRPTAQNSKRVTDKCVQSKVQSSKKRFEYAESDEASDEPDDSTESDDFTGNKKLSSYQKSSMNPERDSTQVSRGKKFSKGPKKNSRAREIEHDDESEEILDESTYQSHRHKSGTQSKFKQAGATESKTKRINKESLENIEVIQKSTQSLISLLNSANLEGLIQKLTKLQEIGDVKDQQPAKEIVDESIKGTSEQLVKKRLKSRKTDTKIKSVVKEKKSKSKLKA